MFLNKLEKNSYKNMRNKLTCCGQTNAAASLCNLTTRGQSSVLLILAISISLHKLSWLNSVINFTFSFSRSQCQRFGGYACGPGQINESTMFPCHRHVTPPGQVNSGRSVSGEHPWLEFTCLTPKPLQRKAKLINKGRNK